MGNVLQKLRRFLYFLLLGRSEKHEPAVKVAVLSKDIIVEAMSCNLLGDLVINILSRLPVKSLLRFRCVSRNWNRLVISPTFIELHYAHFQRERKLLIQTDSSFYLCSRDKMNSDSDSINELRLPFSPPYKNVDMFVAGSSNGLVCIYASIYSQHSILWNPATTEYRFLPPPPPPPGLPPYLSGPRGRTFTSFTFISSINSFKLVSIAYDGFRTFCVDVFTLNNNDDDNDSNCWRRRITEPVFPMKSLWANVKHVVANESLNWLGNIDNCSDAVIISFDMNKEYFYYLTMPSGSCNFLKKKLAVMRDSQLAMFEFPNELPLPGDEINVWRFKLNHDNNSNKKGSGNWILHFVINITSLVDNVEVKPQVSGQFWSWLVQHQTPTPIRIGEPYGFWLNGEEEEIMFWDYTRNLFMYKPRSQNFYRFPLLSNSNIPLGDDFIFKIVSHVDSLFSVKK